MASTLETAVGAVTLGGIVGVVEIESWVEAKMADRVAVNEGPRPPRGAQRRWLRIRISAKWPSEWSKIR